MNSLTQTYKPMKKHLLPISLFLVLLITVDACQQSGEHDITPGNQVPQTVLQKLTALGFDITNKPPLRFHDGYLVEGDLYLTDTDLARIKPEGQIPETEHYCTANRVTGTPRTLTVYMANTFSTYYFTALNTALARFNALGLTLTFTRVTSSTSANIRITRLPSASESTGVIGNSGFPTASGNPYGSILLNGTLVTTYNYSTNGIASIIAHQIGHCIGLLHTDLYDQTPGPCGSTGESTGPIGLMPIPGTPASGTQDPNSFMISCMNGANRPFTTYDRVALNYMY